MNKENVENAIERAESYYQDARPDSWASAFFWLAVAGIRALLLIVGALIEIGLIQRTRY